MMQIRSLGKQTGVVLITAILIVSLVALIATTLIEQQSRQVRLGYSLRHMDQAYLFWDQYERFYLGQMGELLKQNDFNVHKSLDLIKQQGAGFVTGGEDELVCIPGQELEEQGYTITIENLAIRDLQAKFDLNSLRDASGIVNPDKVKMLTRLIRAIEEDENELIRSKALTADPDSDPPQPLDIDEQTIAESIVDWIDVDQNPKSFGAESDYYQGLDIAYSAPDDFMTDISELKMIQGVERNEDQVRIYRALAKHLTVLPVEVKTAQNGGNNNNQRSAREVKLDINRATIPVLQSLHEDFTRSDAISIADGRGKDGYKDLDDFWKEAVDNGDSADKKKDEILKVISPGLEGQYFKVWGTLATGLGRAPASSLLFVDKQGKVTTLWRSRMLERKPSC